MAIVLTMLFHCFLVKIHGTLSNFEPKNHKTFEVWTFLGLLVKKSVLASACSCGSSYGWMPIYGSVFSTMLIFESMCNVWVCECVCVCVCVCDDVCVSVCEGL